ncbi:MAG: hypothetical protein RLZZ301_1058 [Bacteroidota bacterium]|jgi:hypothetical protein
MQSTQEQLLQLVRAKLAPGESMGHILSESLHISMDAAYRRMRNETALTIDEIKRLCKTFDISFDALIQQQKGNVIFRYTPLNAYDFSLESYLEGILEAFQRLRALDDPRIMLTINNTHFFQLLNFPQLVRFKLFFWAKTHLQIPDYKDVLFKHEKTTERAFELGKSILQAYNSIPSVEIFDPELMRGFLRQILYYYKSNQFEDPAYALFLCDRLLMFSEHLKAQADVGKKFIYGTPVPAGGNQLEMYFNETINADSAFYYETKDKQGLFLTHNIMNFLQTTDEQYVQDAKQVIDKQLANSSLISVVNERERNNYFSDFEKTIRMFRKKIEADLEFHT